MLDIILLFVISAVDTVASVSKRLFAFSQFGEASNVSNAGQTRTRVFDPPLVPEVPLSPSAIWSNTTITLKQQFPPPPTDATTTTRDRPIPRTSATTTATSHSSQGGLQGEAQAKVTIPPPTVRVQPPTETQRMTRSAEVTRPSSDCIARQHQQHQHHHTAPGSRETRDEDAVIRVPAHGSLSDPNQARLVVSSLQLQPKTEPAPISAPVVQAAAASHRATTAEQRDTRSTTTEESARYSIPINIESSARKMAAARDHHVIQDQGQGQPKQLLTPTDPHRHVTAATTGAAVDTGKQQQQQQQHQLTVKDADRSGPPSPRPGGGEGDKSHQLGTNLSRVMEVLAKREEVKKPVKKVGVTVQRFLLSHRATKR